MVRHQITVSLVHRIDTTSPRELPSLDHAQNPTYDIQHDSDREEDPEYSFDRRRNRVLAIGRRLPFVEAGSDLPVRDPCRNDTEDDVEDTNDRGERARERGVGRSEGRSSFRDVCPDSEEGLRNKDSEGDDTESDDEMERPSVRIYQG